MVSRLAEQLIERYALGAESVFDPFCGSGAILMAAANRGIPVVGGDLNPYAILLSSVKIAGFTAKPAREICREVAASAAADERVMPIGWPSKHYWFTPATLHKLEKLRFQLARFTPLDTPEIRAVLLTFALSIRLCSRADQRSPKPFISKAAIAKKRGKHLDPFSTVRIIFDELECLYGTPSPAKVSLKVMDVVAESTDPQGLGNHTHVITSPPYINAQDYYRNFKLELYALEDLLPMKVESIKTRFVGTERALRRDLLTGADAEERERMMPELALLREQRPWHACVVHKYLGDMIAALGSIRRSLRRGGKLVMVCGDNLVGGLHIRTWQTLNAILNSLGFILFDQFGDRIACRSLPPTRLGHKGLIKEEMVSAFYLE
jgi:hypothetical protein